MKSIWMVAASTLLLVVFSSSLLHGQEGDDEFGEDSRLNTNLAIPITVPLNPLAGFTNFGWGFTAGAGYNMSRRNAFIGEFMWTRIYPSSAALNPLRQALNSPDVNGHSNVFALTANYRFELRGRTQGVYFIAGGGFLHRDASLSRPVATGGTTTCTRVWLFWGFTCSSGVVTSDQTLASSSSATYDVNGGIGFTFKVAEPRYRIYIEARYHYAPTTPINTQLIPITMGVRF